MGSSQAGRRTSSPTRQRRSAPAAASALPAWNPIDLHAHTTASDGALRPAELVALARQRGLRAIAVTDHDTTDGLEEALTEGRELGVEVLPGVEINTDVTGAEVHVLGYFIDRTATGLRQSLVQQREGRLERARRMVDKLGQLGLPINYQRVLEIAGGGAVGRPHVAQAMVEAGHVADHQQAFDHYIGRQGPAYAPRTRLDAGQAVELILRSGGIPVLAHPLDVSDLVADLVDAGLMGLECYYGTYRPEEVEGLLAIARRYRLQPTGGSDYHGPDRQAELGGTPVPLEVLEGLKALR